MILLRITDDESIHVTRGKGGENGRSNQRLISSLSLTHLLSTVQTRNEDVRAGERKVEEGRKVRWERQGERKV